MIEKQSRITENNIELPFHCKKYIRKEKAPSRHNIHYHDYIEIVYGLEGECNCLVGNDKIKVHSGDMLIIASDEVHEVGMYDKWTTYIVVRFLPSLLFSWGQTAPQYSYMFLLLKNLKRYKLFFKKEEIQNFPFDFLCKRIEEEWIEHKIGYEVAVRAHLLELFVHILRLWNEERGEIANNTTNASSNQLLQSAISYIDENFIDVNRDKCAKTIGVSPTHLSRLFTGLLNISFSNYVNIVKLREAEKLLLTTDMSITDVSLSSGFSSTAYFISIFKKKHHLTPIKYRNSIKQN